jgi:exodeoxyribonuclease-3
MSTSRLRIASWNVNSIRMRLDAVLGWLETTGTDILCLQETKVPDDAFPSDAFRSLGYEVVPFGQKAYNGVAIITNDKPRDVMRGFGDATLDAEGARLVGATVSGVRVYSAYVPNGKVVGSPSYAMKLQWLARLRTLLVNRHTSAVGAPLASGQAAANAGMPHSRPIDADERVVVCGDFNVAAEDRDVHDPFFWRMQVLFHSEARDALRRFCGNDLIDTFRLHHEEGGQYSWWDYRQGAFPKNEGLRIDYVFASRALAASCTESDIDKQPRRQSNPSDHTPVTATFAIEPKGET